MLDEGSVVYVLRLLSASGLFCRRSPRSSMRRIACARRTPPWVSVSVRICTPSMPKMPKVHYNHGDEGFNQTDATLHLVNRRFQEHGTSSITRMRPPELMQSPRVAGDEMPAGSGAKIKPLALSPLIIP